MKVTATSRRILLVATVFLAVGVGFVLGINRGYTEGYNAALNSTSGDAATLAAVLTLLDSEQPDRAKPALEGRLDALLLNNSIGRTVSPLVLYRWIFPDLQETIDRLAARGASYRLENPRADVDPDYQVIVEEAVREILERRGGAVSGGEGQ